VSVTGHAGRRALEVAHASRGRLRVRLPRGAQTDRLADAIGRIDGVRHVEWVPRSRSVLVLYRPDTVTADALVDAIALEADVRPTQLAPPAPALPAGPTTLQQSVTRVCSELDGHVRMATRGVSGLGGLVSLALVAWAGSELVRGRMGPLAWSSALWYAHGLYRDYHPTASEP